MRGGQRIVLALGICCLVPLPGLAQEVTAEFQTLTGGAVLNLDGTVPGSWLAVAGITWVAPAFAKQGGSVNSLQCLATARSRGELQKGLTLVLGGGLFDDNGNLLRALSPKERPMRPAARFSWDLPDFSADHAVVIIDLSGGLTGSQQVDLLKVDCRAINRVRCRSNRETLCAVGNDRFKVQLDLKAGQGRITARSPRSALFTAANPSRADVVVELFDRCAMNDHFWVAVGSTTAASFDVVVEDMLSGETRAFANPGNSMVSLDTAAFPTCP
jgi:hypothetical protein